MKTTKTKDCQSPAIWVGDLGDYNAGILTGEWIDIDQDTTVEDVLDRIARILSQGTSPDSPHEEWIICDYNNIPLSGSYPCLETVVAVAHLVHEYGYHIVKAYIERFGEDDIDELEERYCGTYESIEAYAYDLITECYDIEKMMGNLACYFDYDSFAHDLELGGDITSAYIGLGAEVLNQAIKLHNWLDKRGWKQIIAPVNDGAAATQF